MLYNMMALFVHNNIFTMLAPSAKLSLLAPFPKLVA